MKTKPLTNYLTELDKKRIKNYVLKYGGVDYPSGVSVIKENPNYVNEWLSSWGEKKKKLYRLFGNSFIFSKKVELEKNERFLYELYENVSENLSTLFKNEKTKEYGKVGLFTFVHTSQFVLEVLDMNIYDSKTKEQIFITTEAYRNTEKGEYNYKKYSLKIETDAAITERFAPATIYKNIRDGVINSDGIRWRRDLPDGSYKELRISKGEKIEKAQNKIFDFIDFEKNHPLLYAQYKAYMKEINEFKSQKKISAILCLSIHPLDFMTMSDNDNHWSSCMSWTEVKEGGCYRIGSVEMMNSDNVICAYLLPEKEVKRNWNFGIYDKSWSEYEKYYPDITEEDNIEEWTWNNKLWRCLYYIEKDILLSGKAYPYYVEELNFLILDTLKDLVKEKFNWTYQFGIQEYKDMQGSRCYSFYNARNNNGYIYNPYKNGKMQHKILIETHGMYNDFLNAQNYRGYYCYRNKVKKTKIINVSGEPLSVLTAQPFKGKRYINDFYKYLDEYNERIGDTNELY